MHPHKLTDKLVKLGLPYSTCMWINSFLSGGSQRFRVGHHTTTALSFNIGSPQNCVLVPLLYTLYTPAHHNNTIAKFADDIRWWDSYQGVVSALIKLRWSS